MLCLTTVISSLCRCTTARYPNTSQLSRFRSFWAIRTPRVLLERHKVLHKTVLEISHNVPFTVAPCNNFATKTKHKKSNKVAQEEEEEEYYFNIEDYLDKIKATENETLSSIEELKPLEMTLEDMEMTQIMGKQLLDVAQVVTKSPIVFHLHVFDVKHKSRIVRELMLLRDDWTVQSDEDDLVIVRMPNPNSSQMLQKLASKATKIQEKHQQQVQHIVSKANAKIKQVNIGNNWHKKQHDLLNNATKSANERVKAAIKKLTS